MDENIDVNNQSLDRFLWLFYPTGIILTGLSSLVLIGWHLNNSTIVQIDPTYVPMQYNTALCFLLLGIGTIFYAHSNKKVSVLFGLFTFIIAGLTLLEYVTGQDFGIDYLFYEGGDRVSGPHPGRMALNTSICFVLSSILLLTSESKRRYLTIAIKQLLSAVIVAISGLSLYGYFIGSESASVWADISRMAVHTASGFFIFGIAFFIFKLVISFKLKLFGIVAPMSVALMSTMISIGVFKAFSVQEDHQIQSLTSEFATYLAKKVENSFDSDLRAINRMAERWPVYHNIPIELWQQDVDNYYRDMPSIKKIEIFNSLEQNRLAANTPFKTTLSKQIEIIDDGNGMLKIIVPIPGPNFKDEYLHVSFDFRVFFEDKLLNAINVNRFQILLIDGGKPLLVIGQNNNNIYAKGGEQQLLIPGLDLKLQVFYNTVNPGTGIGNAKILIFFFCVSLTFLLTMIVYFTQLLYREKNELKIANKALSIEKSKAEQANIAKSAFLANMSHEIRTPLNGIIGTNSLLVLTKMDEKQSKYVNRIESCGNILLNLINDILDISKIESKELKLESVPVDLQNVVKEITDNMKFQAEQKGLELIVDYSEDLYVEVLSDPLRLKQILQNLLSNAIKFTEKGQIVLSVKPAKREGSKISVMFEVKDSGIGISPDKFERLFKKFSQVDDSTTRKYGGTGLGLSICKKLVSLLGGSIGAKSKEGEGSTFWFQIPFKVSKKNLIQGFKAAPLSRMEVLEKIRGKRALIVDDNPINCEILEDYLKSWGTKALAVQSAEKSLSILHKNTHFDLIFLDYSIPHMNGMILAKKIRENAHLRDTPIILLSSEEPPTKDQSIIDSELVKPVYPADILAAIAKVISDK